jgi:Tfp pilus assembly protein PilV
MKSLKKNESGFSAVEIILVLVIVALLGVVGWFVYNRNQDNKSTNNTTSTTTTSTVTSPSTSTTTKPVDPTGEWVVFTSSDKAFSVKYPKTWAAGEKDCYKGLALWGNTKSVPAWCHSENVVQVHISTMDGNQTAYGLTTGWKNVSKKTVKVDGVSGERQEGTASGQEGTGVGELPDGTTKVRYMFYTNGKTYFVDYIKLSDYPDVLSDFDLMVTSTLDFS